MENEGLCWGEIQIKAAQRDLLLFHFEKVTSHKWLSSGGGREEKNKRLPGSRKILQTLLLVRLLPFLSDDTYIF